MILVFDNTTRVEVSQIMRKLLLVEGELKVEADVWHLLYRLLERMDLHVYNSLCAVPMRWTDRCCLESVKDRVHDIGQQPVVNLIVSTFNIGDTRNDLSLFFVLEAAEQGDHLPDVVADEG
jgi:hypothetical protein